MKDILEELSAMRREDARLREASLPMKELMRRIEGMKHPLDFTGAFRRAGVNVIAELKRASPSEGMIREAFHPVELAKELEAAGAAALSVLCEPHRFLGDESYLSNVRESVALPLLYKDFMTTPYQIAAARAAGADAVLLIAAVLDSDKLKNLLAFAHELGMKALVETHDEGEIARAVDVGAEIVGVNCRNLRNFNCDTSLLETLVAKVPRQCLRIAESGMHTAEAIRRAKAAGADGFLVGTALMRATRPGDKLKELCKQGNHQ